MSLHFGYRNWLLIVSALTNFALIAKITRPNSLAPKIITTLQTDEWESPRARDSSSSIIEPSDSQGNIDPNVSYEEGHVSLLKWRLFGNRVMFGPDGKLLAPWAFLHMKLKQSTTIYGKL
jgi:hypothetical protein